jgi:hypothetical protein
LRAPESELSPNYKELMMSLISTAMFFVLVASNVLPSQKVGEAQEPGWKQVVVLKSTRSDVESLLGGSRYQGYDVSYDLEKGHLFIEYSTINFCEEGESFGWNVSEWTVIEVSYRPLDPPPLSSLNLDLARFRKERENPCCPDLITYINDDEGVAYTVSSDGILNDIRYFPSSRYNNLRCSEQSEEKP